MPGGMGDCDDMMKIKNNTIIGGDEYNDNLAELKNSVKMMQNMMINLPGQTPMNTQMDDDRFED